MADTAAYDAARAEETGKRRTITIRDEKFVLDPDPPQWALLELARAGSINLDPDATNEETAEAFAAIYDFLQAVIDDSEWGRFKRFMRAKRIPLSELTEKVMGELVAKVAGRPTEPPSPSQPSPSPNGTSSMATSTPMEPAAQVS